MFLGEDGVKKSASSFDLEAVKLEADLTFSRSQVPTQCEGDARGGICTELCDNRSEQFSLGVQHKPGIRAVVWNSCSVLIAIPEHGPDTKATWVRYRAHGEQLASC